MKWLLVFVSLVALAVSVEETSESCYSDAQEACHIFPVNEPSFTIENCHAQYGKAKSHMPRLNLYFVKHVARSFQYLLMSSHFGGYKMERDGFRKLYRKLSDTAWEDAMDLVKYITLRGEQLNATHFNEGNTYLKENVTLTEMESLAIAVDIQKKLAVEAHEIYEHSNKHDPEMGGYVEDKFMHKHAETIRELVGYTTDLKRMIKVDSSTVGLQLFLFDEYLSKQL